MRELCLVETKEASLICSEFWNAGLILYGDYGNSLDDLYVANVISELRGGTAMEPFAHSAILLSADVIVSVRKLQSVSDLKDTVEDHAGNEYEISDDVWDSLKEG